MIEWYTYKHINGEIHVRRYFSSLDIEECESSPFVLHTFGPYEALSHKDAVHRAQQVFGEG